VARTRYGYGVGLKGAAWYATPGDVSTGPSDRRERGKRTASQARPTEGTASTANGDRVADRREATVCSNGRSP